MGALTQKLQSFPIAQLNGTRLSNIWKNWSSYQLAKRFKSSQHPGLPISISLEPTTSCNLRCPHCPSGLRSFTRDTGMLSSSVNSAILDQLGKTTLYITYYFQGEPFLNPDFLNQVKEASSRNIFTATSTNAHYLSEANCERIFESGLSKLIISIDGTTQDTYEKYRIGGQVDKVIEGTTRLLEMRKDSVHRGPWIIWQFILFQHNQHQLSDIKGLAAKLGVDELQIKTAQIYDFEQSEGWIPNDEKLSRYKKVGDKYIIQNSLLNKCWRMWNSAVITWDGDVVPCCFDKDAKYVMGNVIKSPFTEIWNNDNYQNFRSQLFKGRGQIDICSNCSEGTKIWV